MNLHVFQDGREASGQSVQALNCQLLREALCPLLEQWVSGLAYIFPGPQIPGFCRDPEASVWEEWNH